MILYIRNSKDPPKIQKRLDLINTCSNMERYKFNIQKNQQLSYMPMNNILKKKSGENPIHLATK